MAAATAIKRKRKVITLDKKLIIIDQLSKGSSQRQVSALHEFPKSTVVDIWKARDKIKEHLLISDNPSVLKKRCIVKDAQYEELDKACYIWFMQQRSRGAPVSGPLIQEKALQLFPSIYPEKDPTSYFNH